MFKYDTGKHLFVGLAWLTVYLISYGFYTQEVEVPNPWFYASIVTVVVWMVFSIVVGGFDYAILSGFWLNLSATLVGGFFSVVFYWILYALFGDGGVAIFNALTAFFFMSVVAFMTYLNYRAYSGHC